MNMNFSTKSVLFVLSFFAGSFFSPKIFSQTSVITYENAFRIASGEVTAEEITQWKTLKAVNSKLENNPSDPALFAPVAPPSNDDCSNAITLTIGGGDYTYSNVGATANAGDPLGSGWSTCAGGPGNNVNHSVWFKFTVSGGPLNITVSSQGSSNNGNTAVEKAKYAVFSGACGALTQIGTTRGGTYGNFNSKSINIASLANGTYFIETDGLCSQTGTYRIRVDITPTGSPTLWYAAGTIPTLTAGSSLTTGGQWGTYAATTELSPSCGAAGLGFSDWYQFVYNSATMNSINIDDQALNAGFYIGLYNSAGTELVCNKWGQANYASYTWNLSAQENTPMHMPNISLKELGLTNGATYYVRIANTSTAAENVNTAAGKQYTVKLGNYAPSGDSYLDAVNLTITQQPTYSWLTGQTNRYCGHSMLSEPEDGSLGWNIDNSLLYYFNTSTATSVDVKLQNVTYYNHSASTAQGQIAVLTSPTVGTSMGSNAAFTGASFTLKGGGVQQEVMTITGLAQNTDYWILVDGRGTYEGTKLTFDISVSTTQTVLPIEIVDFSGRADGPVNVLNWKTATELNNDYFTLERSADAINFEEVTTVKGSGNSYEPRDYSAIDPKASAGTLYYRLKQTDFTEEVSYSNLVAITREGKDPVSVIYPNPSSGGKVNVAFLSSQSGAASLAIYSVTGQLVQFRQINDIKGLNGIEVDVTDLSKGMYFFSVTINNATENIKFIKQ